MTSWRGQGFKAKRDGNEPEIINALKQMGCLVYRIDKPVDALVMSRGGELHLIEIKLPKGKLTEEQEAFMDAGWPVTVLRSVDDAVEFVQSLTRRAA